MKSERKIFPPAFLFLYGFLFHILLLFLLFSFCLLFFRLYSMCRDILQPLYQLLHVLVFLVDPEELVPLDDSVVAE